MKILRAVAGMVVLLAVTASQGTGQVMASPTWPAAPSTVMALFNTSAIVEPSLL